MKPFPCSARTLTVWLFQQFCETGEFRAAGAKSAAVRRRTCSQRPLAAVVWSMVRERREFSCADVEERRPVCVSAKRISVFEGSRRECKMRERRKHSWQRCGSSIGACGAVKETCSRTPLAAVVAEGAADGADSA